jgi:hypothetical protein
MIEQMQASETNVAVTILDAGHEFEGPDIESTRITTWTYTANRPDAPRV